LNALAITYPGIQPQPHNTLGVHLSKRYATGEHPCFRLETKFTALPGVTVVMGHSGAGKSTLLRCVAGLCDPEQGRIAIGERVLFDHGQKINVATSARNIGFVFQDLALFPHLSIEENVGYGLHRMNPAEREECMARILASFHIAHLRKRLPRETSGGEQQRVALARSLVTAPCILLLDEPLSSLDTRMKFSIIEDLRRWTEEQRIPILYVTHDHEEACALGEHALALHQGQVVAEGPPHEVVPAPAREFRMHAASFENILETTVVDVNESEGTALCCIDGSSIELTVPLVPAEMGMRLRVGIRAGEIMLASARPQMLGDCTVLSGRVRAIDHNAPVITAHVDCGAPFKVRLSKSALESSNLQAHDPVWLVIKTGSCCLLHTKSASTALVSMPESA
jgi:molybdate transport system ATP-binding protein